MNVKSDLFLIFCFSQIKLPSESQSRNKTESLAYTARPGSMESVRPLKQQQQQPNLLSSSSEKKTTMVLTRTNLNINTFNSTNNESGRKSRDYKYSNKVRSLENGTSAMYLFVIYLFGNIFFFYITFFYIFSFYIFLKISFFFYLSVNIFLRNISF